MNFTEEDIESLQGNMVLTDLMGIIGIFLLLLLSPANIIFSLVSWCVLPKWRQFRHYVLATTIFTFLVFMFALMVSSSEYWELSVAGGAAFILIHWLVITTVMLYVEFVKVFLSFETIRHPYIKANIFGWLLPVALTVLAEVFTMFEKIVAIEYFMLILVNIALYLCVLWALWRQSQAQGVGTRTKVILSTFAFVCTGALHALPVYVAGAYFEWFGKLTAESDSTVRRITGLLYESVMLILNIFFLMLKSHRELWREYWNRKRQAKLNAASIPI